MICLCDTSFVARKFNQEWKLSHGDLFSWHWQCVKSNFQKFFVAGQQEFWNYCWTARDLYLSNINGLNFKTISMVGIVQEYHGR